MANVFHEPVGSVPTLHLSFHLDCHYNSIRREDDPEDIGVVPINAYPIGHDLGKIKKMFEGEEEIFEMEYIEK